MKFFKTKYLTPVCLLIFFMPFLRMCKSNNIVEMHENKIEKVTEITTERNGIYIGDEVNLNAYQLGFGFLNEKFDSKILKDKNFPQIVSYTFMVILWILMIVFPLFKKYIWIRNSAISNVILLIISTCLFIKSNFINEFDDVKYGLFIFIIYSVLLIFISNREHLNSRKYE